LNVSCVTVAIAMKTAHSSVSDRAEIARRGGLGVSAGKISLP
jgi:hypothetical protein